MDTNKPRLVKGTPRGDVPAGNPDAERALLGAIIIAPDTLPDVLLHVRPDDFWAEAHRAIFEAIRALYERNVVADQVTIADELNRQGRLEDAGGDAAIFRLGDYAPNSLNARHYADVVARTGDRRRAFHLIERYAGIGVDTEVEPLHALTQLQAEAAELGERITRREGDGLPQGLSAAQLQTLTLPDPIWTADGILAAGATLLCGKSKIGKSWLSLGLALAVATGGPALGGYTCTKQGDVLYLALEDTWQRLRDRIGQIMADGTPWPLCLDLWREWPTLDEGCAESIDRWAQQHPKARLVIVDTLAKVRGSAAAGGEGNFYQADYHDVARLKRIADRRGLTVLIVHHLRKAASTDDPFEEISGTTGIIGAADDALILKADASLGGAPLAMEAPKPYTLYLRGRNIEEMTLAMRFDKALGIFTALGDHDEVTRSELQMAVIEAIRLNGAPMSAKQISVELDRDYEATRRLISRMVAMSHLARLSQGKYALITKEVGQ